MKALVTGGAGFIGSTLVDRLLAEGWRVDVVDDSRPDRSATSPTRGRCRAAVLVPPPRRVVARDHRPRSRTAGPTSSSTSRPDRRARLGRAPGVRRDVNILGSLNVCEGAVAAGVNKVVFAASGGTLYGTPDELPVREGASAAPESPYGVAKKAVGDYLHYYREVRGLEYTALALANVYGPRQDPHGEAGVVAIFAGKLLDHERPVDLRRRRADPRLRLRRRRRRRVRARGRQGRRPAAEHRHRRRDERAAAVRRDGAPHRLQATARYEPPRAGEVATQRARPRPRRDPPRLEAVDDASTRASPAPSSTSKANAAPPSAERSGR